MGGKMEDVEDKGLFKSQVTRRREFENDNDIEVVWVSGGSVNSG